MKKYLIIFTYILMISCAKQQSENTFKGFGNLIIGSSFDSIPSSKLFTKTKENEFELNKFEINKEIGIVEDLNIKLLNGKIYSVDFSVGKFTNELVLKSIIMTSGFEEKVYEKDGITFYESKNQQIGASRFETRDNIFPVRFSYHDNKIVKQIYDKQEQLKDSIEKVEYLKDLKR